MGVELNSLSKPYNMTGWRIGMASGNPEIIRAIATSKANTDSGVFNAVQYAGIEALDNCDDFVESMLEIYERRRDKVLRVLKELGWNFEVPKGTFYLWVPVPAGYTSAEFCDYVFEKAAVVLAPGAAYGENGEGFVRFSLTVEDALLDKALERIQATIGKQSF